MSKSAVCPECKIRPVEAGHYVCAECEAAVGIANGGYPPPTDTPLPDDQQARFHNRRALPVWARGAIVFALVLLGLAIAFEAVLIVSGVNTPPFMVKVKAGMNNISQRADDISRRLYDALR
jgi:hypothetical protein